MAMEFDVYASIGDDEIRIKYVPESFNKELLLHTFISELGMAPPILDSWEVDNGAGVIIIDAPYKTASELLNIYALDRAAIIGGCMGLLARLHQSDYYHGNPILDNIVMAKDKSKLQFVNFEKAGNYPTKELIYQDYKIFARGVSEKARGDASLIVLAEMVEAYVKGRF